MPLINGCQKENLDFRLIELRKLRISDSIEPGLFNNVALSTNYNTAFVAFKKVIKVIKIETILDFEWSKNIINQAIDTYPCFNITLDFSPTFLSVNGGRNHILIASGSDSANNLRIEFYQVALLSQNVLKPFNRLNFNLNTKCSICSLDWHPEFSESLFAAVLTNGSLISIGIDLQTNGVQLLSNFFESSKFTCVCWSPKGKQLVIGSDNGFLTQYKHTNGKDFQKAKSISPPKELSNFKIINVKWVHTSLFQVAFINPINNDDPDTRVVFIYTIPKAQPEYFDFGRVCMDIIPYTGQNNFYFNFCQLGNVLLCSSSCSSEIGVIGCLYREVTPTPVTWNLWILDDTSRIELQPTKDGTESYSCGIAWFKGPTKIFQINESLSYGGENVPLILILSSSGLLCPYYVLDLTNNFYIPNAPNHQPLPINLPAPNLKLEPKLETKPAQQSKVGSVLNSNLMPFLTWQNVTSVQSSAFTPGQTVKSTTPSTISLSFAPAVTKLVTSTNTSVKKPQETLNQSSTISQTLQPTQKVNVPKRIATISEAEIKKKEENAKNEALLSVIKEEISEFDCELKAAKEKYYNIILSKIGDESDIAEIKSKTLATIEMLKLMNDTLKSIDITILNGFMLETFAMKQEAQSRIERDNDPVYTALLNKKALDPISARKMAVIKKLAHYIENQLQECNFILDQEWNEYISTMNKSKTKTDDSSSLYMITHTLSNNHKIIDMLKNQLKSLEPDFKQEFSYKPVFKSINKLDIQQLIDSLEETKIKDNPNYNEDLKHLKPGIKIKSLSNESKEKIFEVLEQRNFVPLIRSHLPLNVESSKMISATVKAKEKLKNIKKKTQISTSVLSEPQNSQTQDQKTTFSSSHSFSFVSTVTTPLISSIPSNSKSNEKLLPLKLDSSTSDFQPSLSQLTIKNSLLSSISSANKPSDNKNSLIYQNTSKTSTPIKTEVITTKVSSKPVSPKYENVTPPSSPSLKFNNPSTLSFSGSTSATESESVPLKFSPTANVATKTPSISNTLNEKENTFDNNINEKNETTLSNDLLSASQEKDKLKLSSDTSAKSTLSSKSISLNISSEVKNSQNSLEKSPFFKNILSLSSKPNSIVVTSSLTSSSSTSPSANSSFSTPSLSTLSKLNEPHELSTPKFQENLEPETSKVPLPSNTSVTTSSAQETKQQPSTTKESPIKNEISSLPTITSSPALSPVSTFTTSLSLNASTATLTTSPVFGNTTSFFGNNSATNTVATSLPTNTFSTTVPVTTTAALAGTETKSSFTSDSILSNAFNFSSDKTSFSNISNSVFGNSTLPSFTSSSNNSVPLAFQYKSAPNFNQTESSSFNLNSFETTLQQQNSSIFSNTTSSFASGGIGVGQAGFNTSFQNTSKFGQFGGPPTFESSPLLGPQAFGSSPTFGGSPSFSSPTYKSSNFGSPATSSASNDSFSNFAHSDAPTFGSLATQQAPSFELLANSAAVSQSTPQSSPFSFGGQNIAPVFSNAFQTNMQYRLPQFSQRR